MYEQEIKRLKEFYENTVRELNDENQEKQKSLEIKFNEIKNVNKNIEMRNEKKLSF